MGFTKGHTAGKGRPKGSKNKLPTDIRTMLAGALEQRVQDLLLHLDTLDGKDYCDVYNKIMQTVLPKQIEAEIDITQNQDFQAWLTEA